MMGGPTSAWTSAAESAKTASGRCNLRQPPDMTAGAIATPTVTLKPKPGQSISLKNSFDVRAISAITVNERCMLRQPVKQNIKPPQDTAILSPKLTPQPTQGKSTSSNNTFDVKKYFPNDLTTKLKETKDPRIVELHKYSTRRQELLKQNKPVATYQRTILKTWKTSDFTLQRNLFTARRLAKLRAPTVFKDSRSVKMWWLTDKLKSSMSSAHRKDRWWIVADTTVLLHDMYFIRDLIKSDESCRMRMPYEVLHDLTAMTSRRNRAWVRIPARKLLTFIERYEGRDNLVIGQGAVDAEDLLDHPLATDAVLNCCMQYLRLYYYVVLITDDPVRKEKAKTIGMPCYTLQEVRDLVFPKYSNHREGKCQITIKVSSVPAVTAPCVPSQGYFLMPPPLHASIGWPSCMKLPPDLTTTASSHIRAADQTMTAPPDHTMAGPFGHIRAAGQTMTSLPDHTMAGPFGHIRAAGQTMTAPPDHTMAGPFGHIRAAGQTMTSLPDHTMAGLFGHIRAAGQTMTAPPDHTMAGPFGHIRAAGQTMTSPPDHTMAGPFGHMPGAGQTMIAPPDHTMAGPFGHMRGAGQTMIAPPDHTMASQSCHTTKSSSVNDVVPLRRTTGAAMRPTSHDSSTEQGHTKLSVTVQLQPSQHYTFYHPR